MVGKNGERLYELEPGTLQLRDHALLRNPVAERGPDLRCLFFALEINDCETTVGFECRTDELELIA